MITLKIASAKAIKYACMNFHYAKAVPVNTIGYAVFEDDVWCGVVLFGFGANNHIGDKYNLHQGEVCELVRVALNVKQKMTSQVVSASLKALKKDCPLIRLVVSYADCDQEHLGTIYQATNWIYVGTSLQNKKDGSWIIKGVRRHGKTISDIIKRNGGLKGLSRADYIKRKLDRNAQEYVTKGKRKYLMPLDKKMRKLIMPLSMPYPKEDKNWQKIDRTTFKNENESE